VHGEEMCTYHREARGISSWGKIIDLGTIMVRGFGKIKLYLISGITNSFYPILEIANFEKREEKQTVI
jgi:hypothetical protein